MAPSKKKSATKKVPGVKATRSRRKKVLGVDDSGPSLPEDVDSRDGGSISLENGADPTTVRAQVTEDQRDADERREDHQLEVDEMRAALAKERAHNAQLQKRLEAMMAGRQDDSSENHDAIHKLIQRPRGTAGTDFSIQESMGLAGSKQKYETYKALQRNLRDLTLNARINWEVPWAQVPARDKAKLFEVARDQHPFLARFERDWATEELVKQFVKNKRKNHYANGWLDVPEKYSYLKHNSIKWNQAGSRSKKALRVRDMDSA